jgi:hypothetical protein
MQSMMGEGLSSPASPPEHLGPLWLVQLLPWPQLHPPLPRLFRPAGYAERFARMLDRARSV